MSQSIPSSPTPKNSFVETVAPDASETDNSSKQKSEILPIANPVVKPRTREVVINSKMLISSNDWKNLEKK